ncbi:MAG: RNA-binding S4 domain-containing protein [Candidatus Zixiibacteriota bacterium]|nr:MAG: RNA-binding S4 domain-containing protein [candidate division Zixibacteria bacterium]
MRLDQYLSKVGLIKRRTVAKQLCDNGIVKVNGHRSKPSHEIKTGDIISVGGNRPVAAEVLEVPGGSIKKEERDKYFKIIRTT